VLKHIALSIPTDNRWYPVFERYLGEMGERIRAMGVDPDTIDPTTDGSGKADKPGRPGPDHGTTQSGKVRQLLYDCFGDFEGFVLEDCDTRSVYRSCDRAVEDVVQRACRERLKVTVYSSPKARGKPHRIVVHCC
jgi:hypothetical protein